MRELVFTEEKAKKILDVVNGNIFKAELTTKNGDCWTILPKKGWKVWVCWGPWKASEAKLYEVADAFYNPGLTWMGIGAYVKLVLVE